MTDLVARHCQACEGGVAPLSLSEAQRMLAEVPGWSLDEAGKVITKVYTFKNYYKTMAFVNAVAWVSHQEDHHPVLEVSWGRCVVRYTTHAIGGLSDNDFICAAKVDTLVAPQSN